MTNTVKLSIVKTAIAGMMLGGGFISLPSFSGSSNSPEKKKEMHCGCSEDADCECQGGSKECKAKSCKAKHGKKGSHSEEHKGSHSEEKSE